MPGYGYERIKLKEYLGIEWVEQGLHLNAHSDKRTIRHASDLDCTFTDPSKCRWKNVDGSEGLDSLDFHLFEKTDFTEFPALQVRPGPSKLIIGDKLLFTGDRKREEKSAIWRSSPIKCQNTTGELSFTFWVYNGARVEVILFERKNGKLRILPEKPYVDCGFVSINTDCIAQIPPRDSPFSIGIRAYDINKEDGSFVMVDNIVYRATLCKISIDLGKDFKGIPFTTLNKRTKITTASELNCADFSEECEWSSVGHGFEGWKVAKKAPSAAKIFNATGTYTIPKAPFIYMYIEQDRSGPFNVLRSSSIDCVSEEMSDFSFRFWTTRNVQLEVCATNSNLIDEECHSVPMDQSPNLVHIPISTRSSFMITIKVKKITPDFDNFIAIDEISYKAVLCSDASNPWDVGNDFFTVPMLSVLMQRRVSSTKDLDCPFDRRAVDCYWANGDDTNPQWSIASTPIDRYKLNSLTKTKQQPDGEFAVVRLMGGQASHLITEPIPCIAGNSLLSFRYWQTGSARLKVCLMEEEGKVELFECEMVTIEQPGPIIIDIPEIKHMFRIALRAEILGASSSEKGIIIVDDIQMTGDICSSKRHAQGVRTSIFRSVQQPDPNVCQLLSCQFHDAQTCLYTSKHARPLQSQFHAKDGYVKTVLIPKGKMAILESPNFSLNAPARLHFTYKKEKSSTLLACHDSLQRELDKCFEVGSGQSPDKWHNDYIQILPSDTKIYLIAKLRGNFQLAQLLLTNITVTDLEDVSCV